MIKIVMTVVLALYWSIEVHGDNLSVLNKNEHFQKQIVLYQDSIESFKSKIRELNDLLKAKDYSTIYGNKYSLLDMIKYETNKIYKYLNRINRLKIEMRIDQLKSKNPTSYKPIVDTAACLLGKTWQFIQNGDTVGEGTIQFKSIDNPKTSYKLTIDYRANGTEYPVRSVSELGFAYISNRVIKFVPQKASMIVTYSKTSKDFRELENEGYIFRLQTCYSVITNGTPIDSFFYMPDNDDCKFIFLSHQGNMPISSGIINSDEKANPLNTVTLDDALYNTTYSIDDGEVKGTITFYINPKADYEGIFKEEVVVGGKKIEISGKYKYTEDNKSLLLTTQKSEINWIVKELAKDENGFEMKVIDTKTNRITTLSKGTVQYD